jgi:hypothetical protein
MATMTWTGAASTDWFNPGNWDTGFVPGSADDAVIGTTVNSPTLQAGTTLQSLTLNGTNTLTLGDVNSGNSVGLDASAGGITVSGGGTITGQGSLTGNIIATGTATISVSRVNAQNTPQLQINGTITDSGSALTLGILDNDAELILTGASQANAVNFGGTTGQLRIVNTTLTMGGVMAIDTGEVFLVSGSTLTAASGITISTGTIFGDGTVAANVTSTGAATIATNFGVLEINGTITDTSNLLTLLIGNDSDTLILNGASAANAVIFATSATLDLNAGATLTVGTQMDIGNGTLLLSGGGATLTDASGVTIGAGTITGSGIVAAAITAASSSSIVATGGTLEIAGAITDSDNTLTLTITAIGDGLRISGAAAANSLIVNGAFLHLATTGTLLLATHLDIGTATVQLDGGAAELNAPTISVSTGTIFGAGRVLGTVDATGAANIIASGGTLELVNQLTDSANALTLTIVSNTDTLRIDFIGSANSVDFAGQNGTLHLTNQGTFTVTALMQVTGTVLIDSSFKTLNALGGISLNTGSIEGFGTVSGTITGSGTVIASGGALELQLVRQLDRRRRQRYPSVSQRCRVLLPRHTDPDRARRGAGRRAGDRRPGRHAIGRSAAGQVDRAARL